MFIIGDFSDRDYFPLGFSNGIVVKDKVTKEDLAETIGDSSFQVINTYDLTYYDPEKNEWVKIIRK